MTQELAYAKTWLAICKRNILNRFIVNYWSIKVEVEHKTYNKLEDIWCILSILEEIGFPLVTAVSKEEFRIDKLWMPALQSCLYLKSRRNEITIGCS